MNHRSALSLGLLLAGCLETAKLAPDASIGPSPILPAPATPMIPTINIAPARGWPTNGSPVAAAGLRVNRFAAGLDHPRWLLALPNGDLLVAETNAPARPDDAKGIRGAIMKRVMKRAGAGVMSANRITLLRDADGDGIAEMKRVFLSGLNSPFGMALVGSDLYVANSDALIRFPYHAGDTAITDPGVRVVELPAGTINHHWTKNVIAAPDGSRLYVTVGSNSNAGERGMAVEADRAAILEVDPAAGRFTVFATGLRNPNGLGWEPETGALWAVVNERDQLGSDLVPDYLTSVRRGGFYGWPYSYYGDHVDTRVKPPRPDLVAAAIIPDYALGTHMAPLGLAFFKDGKLPERYTGGAFIGQHGSWNRRPLNGYNVVFVPFLRGKPAGQVEDVLTGFLDRDGNAFGRPVGLTFDRSGALLVADDVGNVVWRVVAAGR